ncbi:GntR family transcriptional regulator [Bacillus canaveralius]|uniref:GntR family transcriptional regulator n=1 Tax=Bacillus canaveralius TaxID=1403243 RepID=UPI000F7AECA0|nr:GntR family transcriptional regulator [Bacillus canaveralius]RSK55190.1 GntR family transcriptional regulator [Bacillus canaveralius]
MKIREESIQHLKIAEFLVEKIRDGEFKEMDKIPSENELCRQFSLNRHVVRQAIARISNLGWVTPVQGKGCYINRIPKPIQYVLSSQTRFSENMENEGVKHKSRLLNWEKGLPKEEERTNLQLDENETVYRLEILRYVDDVPISVTTSVFPEEEVPKLENYLDGFHSLYELLQREYQFRPIRSKSVFQASLPLLKDAEVLQIPESIPIVQMESMMNHPSGAPVEYSVARVRSDMHKCLVEF